MHRENLKKQKIFCIWRNQSVYDTFNNGDTISTHDLVAQHYEKLPYPVFNANDIAKEEYYYRKNDQPLFPVHAYTLEKMNHYLHGGRETFR